MESNSYISRGEVARMGGNSRCIVKSRTREPWFESSPGSQPESLNSGARSVRITSITWHSATSFFEQILK
jgi:hypothetical protein